jgi:hypothetical protein
MSFKMNWISSFLIAAAILLRVVSTCAAGELVGEIIKPADDVVLRFDFDERKGQHLMDKSGKGNNGLLGLTEADEGEDPGWVKIDASHSGLLFDGLYNNRVTIKDSPSLHPLGRISISAHIKRLVEQPGVIVNKGWGVFAVSINKDGLLSFQYLNSNSESKQVTAQPPLPINQWVDIKVVADFSSKTVDFVVDGKKTGTRNLDGAGFFVNDHSPVEIGFDRQQNRYPFAGIIDRLIITNSKVFAPQ